MAFRKNFILTYAISKYVVTPIRKAQILLSSKTDESIAELLIALVFLYIVLLILRKKWKKLILNIGTLAIFVYAVFCFLWGTYYYGEEPTNVDQISVEQLETVTRYFAKMTNDNYIDITDREEILNKSKDINNGIGCKGMRFSKIVSYLDFSGFFFPFTAEANVNMDMPAHSLPATCVHELAHLNGIAREQEANFYAVKTSLEYGDQEFVYSASKMAYTYLGNALYAEDYEAWEKIYYSLNENVRSDMDETREYWGKFETPVKEASNVVYENFLYSYGQDQGLKSYGACVDLLVNYYYPTAINQTK